MLFYTTVTQDVATTAEPHFPPLSRFFKILFVLYLHPCSAHAGQIGVDGSLLKEHNALLLQQIARDLLHALSGLYVLGI